jgi:uncharacterized membrane protein HdeD (DUF308 family)
MRNNEKIPKLWWLLFAQGVVGSVLGIVFITMPGKSIFWLFLFLGLTLLIQGVIGLVHGLMSIGKESNWAATLFGGVISILFGTMILNWSHQTIKIAVALLGLWAIGSGLIMLVRSVTHRDVSGGNWVTIVIALFELIFGIFLLTEPAVSAPLLMVISGLFVLAVGIFTIVESFEFKKIESELNN